MSTLILIVQILAAFSGSVAALMSITLFVRLRWPAPFLWFLKIYVSALSSVLALIGVLTMVTGLITGSVYISLIGIYVSVIYLIHLYRVTRSPDSSSGFEQAFGLNWKDLITEEQISRFLPARTVLVLPPVAKSRFHQNIPFATIPGTGRKLLCDVWEPPLTVVPSGLAF